MIKLVKLDARVWSITKDNEVIGTVTRFPDIYKGEINTKPSKTKFTATSQKTVIDMVNRIIA